MPSAIVFYISGHGFGHASRMIEVINALFDKRPEARIGVRTAAPRWLFDASVKARITYSHLETDTGVVQVDSLTLDEADTVRRAAAFHTDMASRAASETRTLREMDAGLVVGDIPPLASAVGAAAGIPTIAVGNFTWDWIYSDYPRTRLAPGLLPALRATYAKTYLGLRLPMSGGFEHIANIKDVPFIARHATKTRKDVCKALKIPTTKPIVLLSFGSHGLPSLDTQALAKSKKYTFVTTAHVPLGRKRDIEERKGAFITRDEQALYDTGLRYEDLIASAEAVVTKPGYGIISDCLANDTAILHTPRGHFPEYDLLIREMPTLVRQASIDHELLLSGKWDAHLDKLLSQAKIKNKPETNGAEVVADILLHTLDNPPKRARRPKKR